MDADLRHAEIALALAKSSKMLLVDGKIMDLRRGCPFSAAGALQALPGLTDHQSRSSDPNNEVEYAKRNSAKKRANSLTIRRFHQNGEMPKLRQIWTQV